MKMKQCPICDDEGWVRTARQESIVCPCRANRATGAVVVMLAALVIILIAAGNYAWHVEDRWSWITSRIVEEHQWRRAASRALERQGYTLQAEGDNP